MVPRSISRRRRASRRRGAAIVEFAVVSPVFIAILLGTIEACSMIFLKQSVTMGAYEGTRVSVVPGTTTAQVETAVKGFLDARKVKSYTIQITPSNFQAAAYGSFIQVKVTAPCGPNGLIPSIFYGGKSVTGTVEMMKEY